MRTEPVTLRDFEGTWSLSRDIVHGDGTVARFAGQAVWRPVPDGLDYHETGTLTLPGASQMNAERRYHWTGDLGVFFEDGRFFHHVPPMGGESRHWCDPDQYTALYEFADWPVIKVVWRVQGPRKDYEMTSVYAPSDG